MSEAYRGPVGEVGPPRSSERSRLLRLAAVLVERRSALSCAGWILSALAAATLARSAAGFLTGGVPLVFYLPAVVVVTLFCGWQSGTGALAIGTLLAWFLFVPPVLTWHLPHKPQAMVLLLWAVVAGSQILVAQLLRAALQRGVHSEMRYRRLLDVAAGTLLDTNEKGEIEAPQPGWTELTDMGWPEYRECAWLKGVHADDRSRLTEPLQGGGVHEAEVRLWSAAAADWRWFLARRIAVPTFSGRGQEWITTFQDIHEQKLSADRRDLVIGELRHRLKNLLTIIDALAKNSRSPLETGPEIEAFLTRFLGRLHALGAAADLVLAGRRVAVECGALIRATLSPFMEDRISRFVLSGGELQLSEQTGGTLGLAIHELATNALKYGALSVEGGIVMVGWLAAPADNGDEQVVIEWRERGGPPAAPPDKEGFGTRLIRTVPMRERGGDVQIGYEAEGLYCRVSFLRRAEGPASGSQRDAAE